MFSTENHVCQIEERTVFLGRISFFISFGTFFEEEISQVLAFYPPLRAVDDLLKLTFSNLKQECNETHFICFQKSLKIGIIKLRERVSSAYLIHSHCVSPVFTILKLVDYERYKSTVDFLSRLTKETRSCLYVDLFVPMTVQSKTIVHCVFYLKGKHPFNFFIIFH